MGQKNYGYLRGFYNHGVEADAKFLGAISVEGFRAPLTPNVREKNDKTCQLIQI